ncbi:MAG: phosphate regulon sensor histidine kinase PhoR [Methylococcales bacterium]|nr:MAG: phosphate regulon sensor histidine kinase PhoR [Methylococcales bacterium]
MGIWGKEIRTILLFLLVISIVGGFTGLFWPLIFLLLIAIIARQVVQISRFEAWISRGGSKKYPSSVGIWEDLYYHVYRIKKNEKRRKKKLSLMIDQFRQSTEALPDAAVVLGINNEIDWSNKAARKVFGLQASDKGQRIPNLIRYPEFIRYLKANNYQSSVVIPSPVNSNITLEVRIVPYGAGLRLLLAQDITQLKKMERTRKDFVANVSHELRTPLTVLKGYLETLQDLDDGQSPLLTNSFLQMQGQTERMQHLVDDLLLLTRLETQQKKLHCVDIPALLSQICKEGDDLESATRRIELTLESSAHIMGEEQELRSAFTNLLGNALKYSPEDTLVKLHWYQDSNSVVLAITDMGEGISKTDIPRVTERFYRSEVKRAKKVNGTGLGLAIVKHVLMRHDAQLKIKSELGKGSCFSCHFPLSIVCE